MTDKIDDFSQIKNHTHSIIAAYPDHTHYTTSVMDQFHQSDLILSMRNEKFEILKNRYPAEMTTEKLIPIFCRTIVKQFLDEKMKMFEDSLVEELITKVQTTLQKEQS